MLEAIFAMILMGLVAYGAVKTSSQQFATLGAGKTASVAEQFANIDSNLLRLVDYNNLDDPDELAKVNLHTERAPIQTVSDANGWEDSISLSEEKTNPDDGSAYRTATINVYKTDEQSPTYTIDVPLASNADTYSRSEIDALMTELRTAISNLDASVKSYEQVADADRASLHSTDTNLQTQITNLQTQINNNAKSVQEALNKLQQEIDDNGAAIVAANANINKNAQSIASINTTISSIKGDISNLKTSVTNLQAAVALNKSNIATNASNISKNASDISSNKGAIDALRSQVQSNYSALSQKIAENTSNITSINNRLNGAEFVKNGGANKSNGNGISLDYSNSDQKLHAYYNGSEVPLGSQDGGSSIPVAQDSGVFTLANVVFVYTTPNIYEVQTEFESDGGHSDTYEYRICECVTGYSINGQYHTISVNTIEEAGCVYTVPDERCVGGISAWIAPIDFYLYAKHILEPLYGKEFIYLRGIDN